MARYGGCALRRVLDWVDRCLPHLWVRSGETGAASSMLYESGYL